MLLQHPILIFLLPFPLPGDLFLHSSLLNRSHDWVLGPNFTSQSDFSWPLQLTKPLLPSLILHPIVFFHIIHNTYYHLQLFHLIIYMFTAHLLSPEWKHHRTKNTSDLFTSVIVPPLAQHLAHCSFSTNDGYAHEKKINAFKKTHPFKCLRTHYKLRTFLWECKGYTISTLIEFLNYLSTQKERTTELPVLCKFEGQQPGSLSLLYPRAWPGEIPRMLAGESWMLPSWVTVALFFTSM